MTRSREALAALCQDREAAAAALERAIAEAGQALHAYEAATAALDQVVGLDLGRRLLVPIIMKLNAAGFSAFTERKLQGVTGPLERLCAEQHAALVEADQGAEASRRVPGARAGER